MSLKERITEDMKAAMRAKDTATLGTVRLLLAAIKQREVDERIVLDDAAVVAVIERMLKQRRDSIAAFEQAQRHDLVEKESAEARVLQAYLPQRLDAGQVRAEVAALVSAAEAELGRPAGLADMGRLMAAAKASLAGRADMAAVSAAVRAQLVGN